MKFRENDPSNSGDWNQESFPVKDRSDWKELKERISDQAALKDLGDGVLYQFYLTLDNLQEKTAFLQMNQKQRTEFMIQKQQQEQGQSKWRKELVTNLNDYKAKKSHGIDITLDEFLKDSYIAYRRGLDPAKRMKFESLKTDEDRIEFMMKDFETWRNEE